MELVGELPEEYYSFGRRASPVEALFFCLMERDLSRLVVEMVDDKSVWWLTEECYVEWQCTH